MLIDNNVKEYEKPTNGFFNGTIIDVVDLIDQKTQNGVKTRIRVVWVLGKQDGSGYAVDTEGNPFRVTSTVNATMNDRGRLYELVQSVLGTAPPVPFQSEELIGRSNVLLVQREEKNGKTYANVKGIGALPAGIIPPAIPQGFVRDKNKPKTNYNRSSVSAPITQAPAAPAPQQQAQATLDTPAVQAVSAQTTPAATAATPTVAPAAGAAF